jgi:spore germination protein KB
LIENGKISPLQFGIVVLIYSLGSSALLLPSIVVSIAKQDAWISVLACILIVIPLVSMWTRLARKYPALTIIQYSERIVGKWFGKMIGVMYVWFCLYLSALVLRNLGDFITTNILAQTPIEVVHILFMIPIVYGVYLGLEVISRTSEILFPWIIVIFGIASILLLANIDLRRVPPVLADGLIVPVKAIYPILGFPISELVVLLFVLPFVEKQAKVKKYFMIFVSIAIIIGTIIVIMSISVLGVDMVARSTFAVFDLAKEINVGNFFEREEVLIGGIWIMTIFVKLSVCFYAANLGAAQLFHLKSYRVTILPLAMAVVALSMIVYHNTAESFWFIKGAYPIYSLIFGLVIPACLLGVTNLRKLNKP